MSQILTMIVVVYSYFEIRNALPRLAAYAPAHSGAAAAFAHSVAGMTLWELFAIQALGSILFFVIPFIAAAVPGIVHFGTRRFSDYSPKQRTRLMPLLRRMTGLMGLLPAVFLALRIHWLIGEALGTRPRTAAVWPMVALLAGEALVLFYGLARFDVEAGEA